MSTLSLVVAVALAVAVCLLVMRVVSFLRHPREMEYRLAVWRRRAAALRGALRPRNLGRQGRRLRRAMRLLGGPSPRMR